MKKNKEAIEITCHPDIDWDVKVRLETVHGKLIKEFSREYEKSGYLSYEVDEYCKNNNLTIVKRIQPK